MRARNIKPGFFQNEALAELAPETRLLFVGLWCAADREGRLEDRPKRLKMQIFPGDNFDVDPMLDDLTQAGLIVRYSVDGSQYIEIPKFLEHQRPHHQERDSEIPAPVRTKVRSGSNQGTSQSALIPDTGYLIPDVLNPDSGQTGFDRWWSEYPKKRKKKTALEIWRRKKLDSHADELIADVRQRLKQDSQWRDGFVPDPTTYLNGERWDDELASPKSNVTPIDPYFQNLRRAVTNDDQ